MEKLISMTDYILEQGITETFDLSQIMWYDEEVKKLDKIRSYANFLKQELNIGMFVPAKKVNGVWLVFESYYKDGHEHFDGVSPEELKKSKEKVLFDGFEVTSEDKGFIIIKNKETLFHWDKKDLHFWFFSGSKIEELIRDHELILTQSAKNKLS